MPHCVKIQPWKASLLLKTLFKQNNKELVRIEDDNNGGISTAPGKVLVV